MFRRRRQRGSEPESFKPKQGTSLDSVTKQTDDLKEPRNLVEFKLTDQINENENERISSKSEPRTIDKELGKRVSPATRPNSKTSTPTRGGKLKSPANKATPVARKLGSPKKKTCITPTVLKVEPENIVEFSAEVDDQGSTNSPVSVEAPVPEPEKLLAEPTEDPEESTASFETNAESHEDPVNDDIREVCTDEVEVVENEAEDHETVESNGGGGGGGEVADRGRTANEIAHQEMLLSQDDPTHPPPRYIEGLHGDMPEATRRWANTLKWRKENNIADVAKEPNPQYPLIRKHYSHFFHGHGKTGSVVLYVRPGKSNFPSLWKEWVQNTKGGPAKERLIVPDDLVRHHVFMLESLFQHWGPVVKGINGERATSSEMQRLVAVFDLEGFSFRSLRSFFGVFKKVVQILEQHYVGRADRIMVINAPNFRNVAYLVYPLVPKEVKAKIEICGRRFQSRLRELLVPEEIPKEYGGDSEVPVGEWVLEKHINAMYNHPARQFPNHVPMTGEILEEEEEEEEEPSEVTEIETEPDVSSAADVSL